MDKLFKVIACTVSIITVFQIALPAQNAGNLSSEPYNWKNVQMAGGGFVDGIVFHPSEKGGSLLLPYRYGRRIPQK